MAEHLGVDPNTVTNYVNGHTRPKDAMLRVWAVRTGVDFHELRDGQPTTVRKLTRSRHLELVATEDAQAA